VCVVSCRLATKLKSERYFDATGVGCMAALAVVTAFKSGTFYQRQVQQVDVSATRLFAA